MRIDWAVTDKTRQVRKLPHTEAKISAQEWDPSP